MTPKEEKAVQDTVQRAKESLFDADGKPRGFDWYPKQLTIDLLFRPAQPSEQLNPPAGIELVSWRERLFVYDARLTEDFIEDARNGDYYCDRILRNAAALILEATKGLSDDQLRSYVFKSLSGDNPDLKVDGRATRNMFRNRMIWQHLMLPLIQQGFNPTRNEATESECASSIVSKALQQVGIDLAERSVAEIWAEVSPALAKINVQKIA
jgi:hypothetical protein